MDTSGRIHQAKVLQRKTVMVELRENLSNEILHMFESHREFKTRSDAFLGINFLSSKFYSALTL